MASCIRPCWLILASNDNENTMLHSVPFLYSGAIKSFLPNTLTSQIMWPDRMCSILKSLNCIELQKRHCFLFLFFFFNWIMFFVDSESALKEQELGVILNTVTLAHWQIFCLQTLKVYDQHCVEYRWMAYSVYNCPVLAVIGCTMFYAHPFMKFSVHNFITGVFQWIMAKTFNTGLFTKYSKTEINIWSNIKPYTATVASDFKCFDSAIKPKQ